MKYSFMTFSCPQCNLKELLETAKRYGYDGIEPRIDSQHRHGIEINIAPARRAEIKKQMDESGLSFSCLATSCVYADPETNSRNLAATLRCIDLAADIGAPIIRVFGGAIGKGLIRRDAVDLVAQSLHTVAGHAMERKVTVCMETHDDWCDPLQVGAVMQRVNHPAIAVNWDIMHPVRTKSATMEQAFETLQPWIRHVHVHDGINTPDGKLVFMPIGKGMIDHQTAIERLCLSGYSGFISGEWIGWDDAYAVHLPRELAVMRKYEAEIIRKR